MEQRRADRQDGVVAEGAQAPATKTDSMLSALTERIGDAAVQRKLQRRALQRRAATTAVPDAPLDRAVAGVASGGQPLPFLDQVQASFGRHDVRGVEAHTHADASAAAQDLGAEAYAVGNHVAFGGTPDLHTAAHEAAHVVQQRAGVHLKNGVGEAGDAYEQHADAVANRVVRGESAEALLDTMAGSPGTAAGEQGAVQLRRARRPRHARHHVDESSVRNTMDGVIAEGRSQATPAAMIHALDRLIPLGEQLAHKAAGKAAWRGAVGLAQGAWAALEKAPGGGRGGVQFMMPASTKKGGGLGFPDVCKVPAPPAPFAPIPYPNLNVDLSGGGKLIENLVNPHVDTRPPPDVPDGGSHGGAGAAQDAANAADAAAEGAGKVVEDVKEGADDAGDAVHDAVDSGQQAAASAVGGLFHH